MESDSDAPDLELVEFASRLFALARAGNTDQLTAHIDAGVPVNLCDDAGDTLLMLAAHHGHEPTVRGLLARSADPNCVNYRGQTPLAGAVFKDERAVVGILVASGADPCRGQPSAVDTARMFERADYLTLFER